MRIINLVTAFFFVSIGMAAQTGSKEYNSYQGLVMAGYQGWFNTPDDGAGRNWHHYNGKNGFQPGSCSIDMWPDVSEYEKTYRTSFQLADGSPASVFSSYDESTVRTHFRWMKEYGIDGVFMQRFIGEIRNNSGKHHFNTVLTSAMRAANANDRAIRVMYDLSGMRPGDEPMILDDIDEIAAQHALKNRKLNPSYLYHNGKPLVAVWGVGFNDGRKYGLNEVETIVSGLKARGFSIMLGVPTHWRTLDGDTEPDPKLHELITRCDVIMPWFVGRYNEQSYSATYHEQIRKDLAWAREKKVDYAPLVFPGFTWKNMYGPHTTQIDRNKGAFLWKQLSGAISAGAKMVYVAMFDEIDEGTAIFKCATQVPVGESYFLPIDPELGTDHYLWLTGQVARMLRREIPLSREMPVR